MKKSKMCLSYTKEYSYYEGATAITVIIKKGLKIVSGYVIPFETIEQADEYFYNL